MPRPVIPPSRSGYMVNEGVVHSRYATHAPRGERYRTIDEAFGAVMHSDYVVCGECFPPANPTRRSASRAQAEKVDAPEEPATPAAEAVYTAPAGDDEDEPSDGPQA